jgi:hypothetical protein
VSNIEESVPLVAFSYSATITISRKNKDPLIYLASCNTEPDELVLPTLSDPAKSTKCNLLRLTLSELTSLASRDIEKIQWDREDAIFIGVSAIARFVSPINSRFNASSSVSATCIDKFFK